MPDVPPDAIAVELGVQLAGQQEQPCKYRYGICTPVSVADPEPRGIIFPDADLKLPSWKRIRIQPIAVEYLEFFKKLFGTPYKYDHETVQKYDVSIYSRDIPVRFD